eukprot:CAMPEP_0185901698 /NCGR_PEP_ID=MMETSP0196C-20130402/1034_1 /TAXON_ID=2932 /ORGANISM="Alexandrium fundyense, Strain CCMP1719" /LENGTH=112 /DNA_ID=CAMNT_0028620397 /DNA_START=51 /DNA_END=386 /DNA_ORIENTATION=-
MTNSSGNRACATSGAAMTAPTPAQAACSCWGIAAACCLSAPRSDCWPPAPAGWTKTAAKPRRAQAKAMQGSNKPERRTAIAPGYGTWLSFVPVELLGPKWLEPKWLRPDGAR